jgi:hypothetical protein
MLFQIFFLVIGDETGPDGTVKMLSRAWRRTTLTNLLGKNPLSAIIDTFHEDGPAPEMVSRYCQALGHPELAGHEVEIDYFPLIPMPVYPLSAGDSDASGTCGWLWKFLYLKNVCLGTNVNRCKHVEYVDVAKEEEAGPLLDML